jgi:hypothetical protein
MLSHQRGKKKSQGQMQYSFSLIKGKRNRVWRQLCECLSEAAGHLPPTVSQLLLQTLFTADLRNELYIHLALQAVFI